MILTVFRSRLNEGVQEEYGATAARMADLADTMPGFKSRKVFVAEDGERLSLVEFEDEESHRNWASNAEHNAAQERGRASFYAEYAVQVCKVVRESRFTAEK